MKSVSSNGPVGHDWTASSWLEREEEIKRGKWEGNEMKEKDRTDEERRREVPK